MLIKVVFLLSLFGVASSQLRCDPVPPTLRKPTPCSNYKQVLEVVDSQEKFSQNQARLEQRIDDLESRTQHLESENSKITKLQSALKDLERMNTQTETELKEAKTQLEKHKVDIASLRKEVHELVKHKERVGGNFSEIEKKLDSTERQLREKKATLENLETETKGALNDTQTLLSRYKDELSHLNTTAHELEVKVEARIDATKTDLEAKLKRIKNNNEGADCHQPFVNTLTKGFNAKLNEQKAEVDKFKNRAHSKISDFDKQLKAQRSTVDQQTADIGTLKSDTTGIKKRLKSTEDKVAGQYKLNDQLNRISAEVNAKVAFSASITESPRVITRNILIFNRVFTNIGKAYNSKTGIFTAPLKGVYHFSFMTFGNNGHTSGARLVKNRNLQVSTWGSKGADASDTTSNTVILELNARETVNIILWKRGKVQRSVFSGFLVFRTG